MRKPVVVGNWKMYTTADEATALAKALVEKLGMVHEVEIGICPPAIHIPPVSQILMPSLIEVGIQNLHAEPEGAFTGEISPAMAVSYGCLYAIIGHSERRQFFGETNSVVNQKVVAAAEAGLVPILCVGETLEERETDQTFSVIEQQLTQGWDGLLKNKPEAPFMIAYEPVWAIGTGRVATPEQAQEVHAFIRGLLKKQSDLLAQTIRIQYGGSVKPDNVASLISEPDIDGALVGGASLKADSFFDIVSACI